MILAGVAWAGVGLAAAAAFSVVGSTPELVQSAQALGQLDAATKRKLLAAHERFRSLSPQTQEEIRRLHEAIYRSDRAGELFGLMEEYSRFLTGLPPFERFELQRLPPEERVARAQLLYAERRRHKARMEAFWGKWRSEWHRRLFPSELTPEDVAGIARWAEEFGAQYAEALLQHVPAERRQHLRDELQRTAKDPVRRREILGWLWLRWQMDFPGKLPPMEPAARQQLLDSLTPQTRRRVAALPEAEQDRIFFRALRYLVASQFAGRSLEGPPPVISEQELALFLQQTLSPERREELFRIEPGERMGRLWWEFLRARWADVPEGQPPFFGGRPPGRPPGMGASSGTPPFGPGPGALRMDSPPPPGDGTPGQRRASRLGEPRRPSPEMD